MGQTRRLPSFRKKPQKLVAADKSELDPNFNPVNTNSNMKQNTIAQGARDSTSEVQPTDCSWEWSIGKSIDEADKSSKVGVIPYDSYDIVYFT